MDGSLTLQKRMHRGAGWRVALSLLASLTTFPVLADCGDCAAVARRFAAKEGFNGVVLVGLGSKIDYAESFGMADVGTGRALTVDTPFETGSISKWIAALVVMRLVQQGQVSLAHAG